jgi:Tfp pilus assembly protein PilW
MPVKARPIVADERGTTMAELLVGLMAGMIVLVGLSTLVILTLHTVTRTSARVDATSTARVGLNRLLEELHSACVAPKAPPIRENSSGTELRFVHATGSAATPTPVLSKVRLTGTTLTQADYAWKEGSAPFWVFNEEKPISEVALLTNVSPISATKPVFSYFASAAESANEITLATPLSQLNAEHTIEVGIAFMVSPGSSPAAEADTPARMRGGATFRLSAVSYNEAAPALPCQ